VIDSSDLMQEHLEAEVMSNWIPKPEFLAVVKTHCICRNEGQPVDGFIYRNPSCIQHDDVLTGIEKYHREYVIPLKRGPRKKV